jgi:REP element-mobilizing transposase RayT
VLARGSARQRLFPEDAEREDVVQRLARLAAAEALTVYAWALLPNHFHLVVRTGRQPLARSMRSLLTGYAGAFNRRSRRRGHVLQNRYTSVVCDEAVYCLALVRSLHLKPVRARLVAALEGVAKYADSGHGALVGTRAYGWQDTEAVLTQFGRTRRRAQREYLRFVAAGVKQGRRVELQGGGLIRSAGGWQAVQALRRGRQGDAGEERLLGSREFVEQVRREVEGRQAQERGTQRVLPVERVIERVWQAVGVRAEELRGRGRRAAVSRARAGVAYLWLEGLGQSGPGAVRALGVHRATLYAVARRGRQEAAYWEQLCAEAKPEFPCNVP